MWESYTNNNHKNIASDTRECFEKNDMRAQTMTLVVRPFCLGPFKEFTYNSPRVCRRAKCM